METAEGNISSDRGDLNSVGVDDGQQTSGVPQAVASRTQGNPTPDRQKSQESIEDDATSSNTHVGQSRAGSESEWESEEIDNTQNESNLRARKGPPAKRITRNPKRQGRNPRPKGPHQNILSELEKLRNIQEDLQNARQFFKKRGKLDWGKRIEEEVQKALANQREKDARFEPVRKEVEDEVPQQLLDEQVQSRLREKASQVVEENGNEATEEEGVPMGDAEFRERVQRRFGHSLEQLRVLLAEYAEEESTIENTDENKYTWIKVDRKHLLPDTLMAYALPWEWDKDDPNYIVIQQYLSPELSEELFEHTKRLKARHTTLSTMNNTGYRSRHSTFATRRFTGDEEPIAYSSSSTVEVEEDGYVRDYRLPECEETGEPLSFDVNMRLPVTQNATNEAHKFLRQNIPGCQGVDISSSRISGHGKIDLYRKDTTMDSQNTQMSWTHMEREARTFDEFIKFASQAPGLLKEDAALILKLLERARARLRPTHDGEHLENFVIRSVGRDPSGLNKSLEEKSAIFTCFPLFSIESMNKARRTSNSSLSRTRGLLQTYYHLEATRQRELEQAVPKTGQYPKHHIVHVPQLWAVVLSSRFLITCCSVSFAETGAHSLNIMDPPKPQSASAPSIIRLTDHLQRVFFVPMEHCRTWFALMDKIKNHCLSDINFRGRDCQLFTPDDRPVKSGDWQSITTNYTSPILRLDIRLVVLEVPEVPRFAEPRNARYNSPYGASDHESLDDDEPRNFVRRRSTVLVQRVPTWCKEPTEAALIVRGRPKRFRMRKTTSDIAEPRMEDGTPINRAVRRPVPPDTGIIVNVEPPSDAEGASGIYFIPNKSKESQTPKVRSNDTVIFPIKYEQKQPDPVPDRRDRDPKPAPIQNPTASGQPSEEAQRGPLQSNPTQIKLNVPPVFTWATGRKSNPEIVFEGGVPPENPQNPDKTDLAEEETLIYVCSYIHAQLLDTDESAYEGILSHPLRATEEIVQQLFNASVSDITKCATAVSPPETEAHLPPWKGSLRQAAGYLFKFLDFFLPIDYRCEAGDKYLGAVSELLIILSQLCNMSHAHDTVHRGDFEIIDISDPNDVDLRGPRDLEMLQTPISACIKCYEFDKYSTRQAALDHLRSRHFRSTLIVPDINSFWIMDQEQRLDLCCRRDGEKVVSLLLDHCKEFEKMVLEIQHGVSENGKFDRDTYRIPPCLVDSFKYLLMMVVYGAELAKSIVKNRIKHRASDVPLTFFNTVYQQQLVTYGAMAEGSMENAKEQILLMAITDDTFDIGGYQAVSPEYILLTLMDDLRSRDSANKKVDLIDIYLTYMRRLQFKVSQNPHHRLLRDLRFVIEELDILRNISQKQRLLFANYCNLLDPSSFRITTESRKSAFAIEENKLRKYIGDLDYDIEFIDHLIKRAESLARQTQSGVEVRQEDHGKAILVFTIVTVVFLPLSFVTSYFGMNTVDIRDMGSNQTMFWVIAVPVTVFIISASLVIGFKADDIRDAMLTGSWGYKTRKFSRAIQMASDNEFYNISGSTLGSKSSDTKHGLSPWFRYQSKSKSGAEETIQHVV